MKIEVDVVYPEELEIVADFLKKLGEYRTGRIMKMQSEAGRIVPMGSIGNPNGLSNQVRP